jgi:hypothetical protein
MIRTGKKHLLTILSSTENHSTVGAILKLSHAEEQFGEMSASEIYTCCLIISLNAEIFEHVSHHHSIVKIGRHCVIVHVALVAFVAILKLDVVRLYEIGVEPFIEYRLLLLFRHDHARRVWIIIAARSERQRAHSEEKSI